MADRTTVYLEAGKKRVFASALEWPGWSRSGRDEEQALSALAAYAPRYAVVAAAAGVAFPQGSAAAFDVQERLAGNATTDFGAPALPAASDASPLSAGEAERIASLVAGAWQVLDDVVARAPAELAKGPRGGGRDRDRVVEHVLAAEEGYGRKIGVRLRGTAAGGDAGAAARRAAILDVLRRGEEVTMPRGKPWPLRYAARRIAWHVTDHAWEIEDRGGLTPARAW